MPSVKQREDFDKRVKELIESKCTDEQIAIITHKSVRAVQDSRRRLGFYKIAPREAADEETIVRKPEKIPRKYKVVVAGKEYWCVNEFFGIWER